MAVRQITHNLYTGPLAELPSTKPSGSRYLCEDTQQFYGYDENDLPFEIGGNVNQDNIAKVIYVYEGDLGAGATLEERLSNYVNTLNYEKLNTDAEIWVEYSEEAKPLQSVYIVGYGCPPNSAPDTLVYHSGSASIPINGDILYTDIEGTITVTNAMYAAATTFEGSVEAIGTLVSGVWTDDTPNCE